MENLIIKIIGENNLILFNELYDGNLDVNGIVRALYKVSISERNAMIMLALLQGKNEFHEKLKKADKIIVKRYIEELRETIKSGDYQEELEAMSREKKEVILMEMRITKNGYISENQLSAEDQQVYKILKEFLKNDVLDAILANILIASLDEWISLQTRNMQLFYKELFEIQY